MSHIDKDGAEAIAAQIHYLSDLSYEGRGLDLTGAHVGQYVKVASVDANGTPTSFDVSYMDRSLVVTCVTQDSVTVTGQLVTVRQGGPTGPIFATAAYDGQPVSFSLPVGFAYHVSVSDGLASHFNPTTASGIVSTADIAVTLTYSDFSNIRTGPDVQAALDNDIDLTLLVGETITCSKGAGTLSWDVADYDATDSTDPVVTLLLHDALDTKVFEPKQVMAWFESGLAAGNYSFVSGSTTYYLTLTQAIPADGQLTVNDAITAFTTYASTTATTTLETGTVTTTEISGATSLGTLGVETGTYPLNHLDRIKYGSNNAAEAALTQWLKSDAAANTPVTRVNKFSRPQTYSDAGFLNGLDADFLACVSEESWPCVANNVYEAPASVGGLTTKGQQYTVKQKFFLASEREIFGSGVDDGTTQYDLFVGSENVDRIKYRNNTAQYWWLRTPDQSIAYIERFVSTSGAVNTSGAYSALAVVPACRIRKSDRTRS